MKILSAHNQYAGDVSPGEAYGELRQSSGAGNPPVLIDVRTKAEWAFVGCPDLPSEQLVLCEWQIFPSMQLNPNFVEEVTGEILARRKTKKPDGSALLFFLCRSGARSQAAAIAMTKAGFSNCFNIKSGFEGELDGQQHRASLSGWKAENLPWRQS